jgi:hypothetical protein
MKKIGFIGAFEKTDLIIYVAKIISETSTKVLVIDSTTLCRARYIVPAISPSKFYITEYEGIDVAIGFNDFESIKEYLGVQELNYGVVLIDIDSPENFKNFQMTTADKNYFVTAFDNYSLKRGLEIIGKLEENIAMTKVMFSRDMLQEEEDYLNFLSFYYSIQWDNDKIYFPYEQGDNTVIIENQRAAKIRFKNLTLDYRYGLEIMAEQIMPEKKESEIKKIMKNI